MNENTPDEWRLPVLERLGEQLERLEADSAGEERPRSSRRRLLFVPAVGAAVALTLVLLLSSGGAAARSIVNEAPAAAIRAASVQFRSRISISRGARSVAQFAQSGAMDFANRAYRATLTLVGAGDANELRSVGGVLYLSGTSGPRRPGGTSSWTAARLSRPQRAALASAPESDALTDPLAVLRVLADIRAPVRRVGGTTLEGIPVTHYRLATDLHSVLGASRAGAAIPSSYRRVPAELDVWLDRQRRPRQVEETFTSVGTPRPVVLRLRLTFSAYGQPVVIRAPAGVAALRPLGAGPPDPLVGAPSHIFEGLLRAR